jgi:hypothetical protein
VPVSRRMVLQVPAVQRKVIPSSLRGALLIPSAARFITFEMDLRIRKKEKGIAEKCQGTTKAREDIRLR